MARMMRLRRGVVIDEELLADPVALGAWLANAKHWRPVDAAPSDDAAMVKVHAVAPYELADVMAEWCMRAGLEAGAGGLGPDDQYRAATLELVGGLGPPWPTAGDDDHDSYGRRMAAGFFTLLKEV